MNVKNRQSLLPPPYWVIEPEAVKVVRRIYQIALDGYGLEEIAASLEKGGIVSSQNYWKQQGDNRGGAKPKAVPATR